MTVKYSGLEQEFQLKSRFLTNFMSRSKMMCSCKYFPHAGRMPTLTLNWMSSVLVKKLES